MQHCLQLSMNRPCLTVCGMFSRQPLMQTTADTFLVTAQLLDFDKQLLS